MKLKSKYSKQEDIPESVRDFYEERDGAWVLDHDIDIPNVSSIRNDLSTERRRRQELESKIQKWESLGKSDEEIAALIEKHKKLEEDDLESKGKWDQLKAQLVETHNAEKNRLQKKIDDLTKTVDERDSAIREMLLDSNATAAIAEHDGDPELLMPFVRKRMRVVEAEGRRKIEVLGEDGNVKMNGKGEPISVSDLIAEMRGNERFGKLFKGSGASGGGTPPGGGGGSGGGSHQFKRRSELKTEKERAAFIDAHGLDAYKALPQ